MLRPEGVPTSEPTSLVFYVLVGTRTSALVFRSISVATSRTPSVALVRSQFLERRIGVQSSSRSVLLSFSPPLVQSSSHSVLLCNSMLCP